MELFPHGGSYALEGDNKNGSKERVNYPVQIRKLLYISLS